MKKETKNDIIFIFILFLLTLIFFWKVLINPDKMIYPALDIVFIDNYWKIFVSNTFNTYGELPLWIPLTHSGNTFIGNFQSALFYPINFLYLFFPIELVYGYVFLIDVFLAGFFMYLFVRILGLDKYSSFFSAIAFMFSSFLISKIYMGGIVILDPIIWIPLIFLFFEFAIKKHWVYGLIGGVPLGLQLIAGHQQYPAYTLFSLFLYFLYNFAFFSKKITKRKLVFIFILLVSTGFSLSAIQFLPFIELSSQSIRTVGTDYKFITDMSFPIKHLITLIIPEFFGTPLDNTYWGSNFFWELSAYIGIVPLMMSLFAVLFRRNKYVIFFGVLAALSLLLAFGKYNPLFNVFYNFVPIFSMFRGPGRIVFLYVFSTAILSGFGYKFLTEKIKIYEKKKLVNIIKIFLILSILIAASIGIFILNKDYIISLGESTGTEKIKERMPNNPIVAEYYLNNIKDIAANIYNHILSGAFILLFSLASLTALIFFKLKNKIDVKLLKILLIILVLFDLWFFGMKYIDVKEPEKVFEKSDIIDFLTNDKEKYRVLIMNESIRFAELGRHGIELVGFYDQSGLKRYSEFLSAIEDMQKKELFPVINQIRYHNLVDMLNVKYAITNGKMDDKYYDLRLKGTAKFIQHNLEYYKDAYVYENKNFLPRAFIVHKAKIIKRGAILNEVKSEQFNPREYVVLEDNVDESFLSNSGEFQKAEIIHYSPNKVVVKANLKTSGFLVLSDNWYPGWKAFDNGNERQIYRANYILRSIFLESGEHIVEFVYHPLSFKIGFVITLFTAFVICIAVFKYRKLLFNTMGRFLQI